MYNLTVAQREIEGPEPIERTLLLNEEPIAVAFIDPEQTEATLVWPAADDVRLTDVIDSYLTDYLGQRSFQPDGLVIEYRINDQYYKDTLYSDLTVDKILTLIDYQTDQPLDLIELLDISTGNTTLEMVFDHGSARPNLLALLMSGIEMQRLIDFFSRFHKNETVRSDTTVAATAFHSGTFEWTEGCGVLSPLPVIEGEERKTVVKGLHDQLTEQIGEDI